MNVLDRAGCPNPGTVRINKGVYYRFIKRPMDVVLSAFALIVLSPVLVVLAVGIKSQLGSPVIFKQKRVGLHEKVFTIYKFRTMTDERNSNGDLLPDGARLTKLGRLLRSASLDELPELVNIIKGDMSIIGPRPLAVEYLPFYNELERRRHDVRPGLSGLAQIHGRNELCWEEKFDYDIRYVENIKFLGDIKIIVQTIVSVFKREAVCVRGRDTVEDFHTYRIKQRGSTNSQLPLDGGC